MIVVKKTILFGLMYGISSVLLWGAPAIKSPIQTKLPDNTTLTVFLHGDEFFNYSSTEDGYAIVKNKHGFYEYAFGNEEGHFVASGVKSHDLTMRSKSEEQFLSSFPKGLPTTSQKLMQENRTKRLAEFRSSMATQAFPTIGNMKALVLLVEYQDVRFVYSNERMDRFFNQTGYSDDNVGGSAKDFFRSSSFDQYQPEFVVVGPITLPNNRAYYGGENKPAWQMVTHGCDIAKRELGLDFSQFDANSDGEVDVVYCVFAGYDRAQGGGDDCVWSHASGIGGVSYDGKRLGKYACSSELRGNSGNILVGCGTFCHEFGHVLGLPDMYETDDIANGDCQTPDSWTTMASGGYNNNGKHPPLYSAYERHILNWINLDNSALNQPGEYELQPLIASNQAYKIETKTPGDFYIFEYRRKTGFDAYLADEGLLVWHIDRSNTPIRYDNVTTTPADLWNRGAINNIGGHPLYDIVESTPIAANANTPGNRNVVFPGNAAKTSLTDSSYPNMKSWAGENTEKPVTNIRITSGKVLFDFIAPPDITNNGGTMSAKYETTDDPASDPALLIDNNINTYYSRLVARASSYWVQYQSTEAAVITAYNLTSSDGYADRDPRSWTLSASNDGETWTNLDSRSGEAFTGRKQLNAYKFENETPYLYYRLEITEMNGSIGVQLSEWELHGYTQPDAPSGINAQWDRRNQQVNLHWMDNFVGETAFEIERSENGKPYEFLDSTPANQTEFTDNTALPFKRYIYRVRTTVPGLHSVWAESGDVCTDLNIAGNANGIASAEYEIKEDDAKSDPKNLFDGNIHTSYYRLNARANSYWVQYQSNRSVIVTGYAITAGDTPAFNPRNWTLSVSTDGENWTVLDSREEQFFTATETINYPVDAPAAYTHFRLNVTKINDSKALQIAEWEIIGHIDVNTLVPPVQSADRLSVSTTVSASAPWTITNIEQYPGNEVNVYNLSGIKVFSSRKYTNDWTGKSLPRGVYIYEVKPGNGKAIERGRLLKTDE
jgi:M6 family metalloprotease-like protein